MKSGGGDTLREICRTCGKRIAPNRRAGSLTSYLFSPLDCTCPPPGQAGSNLSAPNYQAVSGNKQAGAGQSGADSLDFCLKCGLAKPAKSREGSITGFMFQSTRCKCPPDKDFADGRMSQRFSRLKQAQGGVTFNNQPATAGVAAIGLVPGATIGGAYQIVKMIGRGGMGEVYLATHSALGKRCALKVIPPDQVTEVSWQRFQQEAKAVARLDHINLVRVTDLGIHESCLPFYAMDFVEGKTLAEILAESGPLPIAAFLEIFSQVCDGVDCAHRSGILHRDLKPANIMVHKTKDGHRQAKVLDFGLAKLTGQDRAKQSLTAIGDIFGSPFYMSPEQCSGEKLDRRSDIYSLGCTMFECLTGRPPFAGHQTTAVIFSQLEAEPPTLESIAGKGALPPSMEVIIAKTLRKNPVERYQSLPELRLDLDKVSRGEQVDPFYISRSARPAGSETASAEAAGTISQSNKKTGGVKPPVKGLPRAANQARWQRPALILPAVALLALALLGTALYLPMRRQTAPAPAAAVKRARPAKPFEDPAIISMPEAFDLSRSTKTVPLSARETEPYSEIIEKDGSKWRVFHFPDDVTIGRFGLGLKNTARATLYFPVDQKLDFRPDPIVIKYPAYLKRFRRGDINGVTVTRTTNFLDDDDTTPEDYVKALSIIPGVTMLTVLTEARKMQATDIGTLGSFDALKIVNLTYTRVDAHRLAQSQLLKKIELFSCNTALNANELLEALKDSKKIRAILLPNSESTLLRLAGIANSPNLEELWLERVGNGSGEDAVAALNALSKANSLKYLRITKLPLNEDCLSILKKFKQLRLLCISASSSGMSSAQAKALEEKASRLGLKTTIRFDYNPAVEAIQAQANFAYK